MSGHGQRKTAEPGGSSIGQHQPFPRNCGEGRETACENILCHKRPHTHAHAPQQHRRIFFRRCCHPTTSVVNSLSQTNKSRGCYSLVDCACHDLDAASALVLLRDAHAVDLHVVGHPGEVRDGSAVREFNGADPAVANDGRVQC